MTSEQEQLLFDTVQSISTRLDHLTGDVEKLTGDVEKLTGDVEKLTGDVVKLTTDVVKLTTDVEKFNDRFSNYQQATQWVVQLAFTLIVSATVIVIISNVLGK